MAFDDDHVLVSCEHASNRLPDEMEAPAELMERHVAWDPGALPIARRLAKEFDAPLHQGEYSRLVVDLNRTVGNSRLIRRVSDGHEIDFNRDLDPDEVERRIERYYRPYREAVFEGVTRIIDEEGRCVHLCIHTFTPVLDGTVRGNDIGLLYDPSREPESAIVRDLREDLTERSGLTVWLNRPYQGTADGILPRVRERHSQDRYVAIELEVNQKFAVDPGRLVEIADDFAASLREVTFA